MLELHLRAPARHQRVYAYASLQTNHPLTPQAPLDTLPRPCPAAAPTNGTYIKGALIDTGRMTIQATYHNYSTIGW